MRDLISVIIPAYNVEPYIEKCIQSVLNQTWDNIEVLIVDDGSTDNTGRICDELAFQHSSIKVIHQANSGLSVARNVGIENSNGNWIAFLDSDDWVEPEMYETLLEIALENNVDLSSCLSRDVNMDDEPIKKEDSEEVTILSYEDICVGLLTGNKMRFEVWNKLWRRELIDDVRFIPGQVAEDVHFDRLLFSKAQKIAHIDKTLHNYLILRPGNTNSTFKVARLCIFDEFKQWIEALVENHQVDYANNIASVAINFSVDIYRNAARSHQDKAVLDSLLLSFDFLYPYYRKCRTKMPQKRKLKIEAFKITAKSVFLY